MMELRPVDSFEERIFRKSQSVMTLRFYRAGKRKFDQYVQYGRDLEHVVSEIKTGKPDVYKVLDDYAGWLIAQGLKPKTLGITWLLQRKY